MIITLAVVGDTLESICLQALWINQISDSEPENSDYRFGQDQTETGAGPCTGYKLHLATV